MGELDGQAHAAEAPVDDPAVPLDPRALGDRDAEFTAFATTAQAELGRMAWLLTGDVHLAAELVQTALVRTYTAWPRARAGDPLAYARRVLANARIDLWRRRRREVLVAPDDVPHQATADAGATVEHRDELVRALAELSPQQRRVVVLRYLVGLSEREVADDLGVSAGTVKTQASRGLHRLRASLGELPGESGD
ncbi:SigE family RNA polymerase sigma factor [Cellulomonas rhizosphaerae]|uniref:SigE family RNA polymerase sigma factor n=1 Tax=Cellulomonas rhizosphaerae TaxID=2293719 RepID=A0A413RJG1_9CELL|nr:SigE family RNA polymerase sigma factor [Cellulomonas rhizosphaerae]RHA38626.1 SigE family RNA polymerase sigma factor [Cellulomonas rhizosphaerae]